MLFLSRSLNHIVMHMLLNLLRIVRTWYKSAHSILVDMHTKTGIYIILYSYEYSITRLIHFNLHLVKDFTNFKVIYLLANNFWAENVLRRCCQQYFEEIQNIYVQTLFILKHFKYIVSTAFGITLITNLMVWEFDVKTVRKWMRKGDQSVLVSMLSGYGYLASDVAEFSCCGSKWERL